MKNLVLPLGLAVACGLAQAQTMYRCGSVYQDRPCAAGQAGRAVGSTGAAASAAAAAGGDAECVQRGKDSLKIVWSREGGATEEQLLADAKTVAEKRLVQNVYRRPGAASTVQAAVEADCVLEKQKAEEDTARAIAAALKASREGTPAPSPQGLSGGEQTERKPDRTSYEADRKKEQCARYDAQMNRLRDEERAGGSAQRMDKLNEARRRLHGEMASASC